MLDAESVAGHLLKADSMFAFLAAHRSQLFPEEMFADLFPSQRGRPSVPAEVMASVILAAPPRRSTEPTSAAHHGPDPHRHHLGHRLTRPHTKALPQPPTAATLNNGGAISFLSTHRV
nr:hypothetical protein RC58_01470 [Mycobacterium avium subsp. paratuberculosis]